MKSQIIEVNRTGTLVLVRFIIDGNEYSKSFHRGVEESEIIDYVKSILIQYIEAQEKVNGLKVLEMKEIEL